MNYTVLKATQLILSAMSSDEVNDINDTVESQQVVDILETTFNDIVTSVDFPNQETLIELDSVGDPLTPTLMSIPEGTIRFDWLQFDHNEGGTERDWQDLRPLTKYEFLRRMNALDTADTNIYQFDLTINGQTFDIRGYNDAFPQYYTCISNTQIIFDNYRADLYMSTPGNRTQAQALQVPTFSRTNTFVPNLDPRSMSLWFNESKAQAFLELKQSQNPKAEQRARRALVGSQHHKSRVPEDWNMYRSPNFGRGSTKPRIF